MKKITLTLTVALIAYMAVAPISSAQEGTYYEGVQRVPHTDAARAGTEYGYTGSVSRGSETYHSSTASKAQNSGDYYGGTDRPN